MSSLSENDSSCIRGFYHLSRSWYGPASLAFRASLRPAIVLSAMAPANLLESLGDDFRHLLTEYTSEGGNSLYIVFRGDIEGMPVTDNPFVESFRAAFVLYPDANEIQMN